MFHRQISLFLMLVLPALLVLAAPATGTTPVAPDAVPTLRADPGTLPGQIALTWTAPGNDGGNAIQNYQVWRGTTSGGETLVTTISSTTTYTEMMTSPGPYYYEVAAVNGVGPGPRSPEACGMPAWLPTTSEPCPAPAGYASSQPASETIPLGGNLVATPPVQDDIVELHGAPDASDSAYYDLVLTVGGSSFRVDHVYTAGTIEQDIDAALVDAPSQTIVLPGPYTLSVTIAERYDPSVGPTNVGWYTAAGGQLSTLTVSYQITAPDGSTLSSGTCTFPLAGAVAHQLEVLP